MTKATNWVVLIVVALLCTTARAAEGPSERGHVVVIAIDGLPAYLLPDPKAPIPTLRKLMREGTVAEGMVVSNPSVTWPNHTTIVSGVKPDKHSVLFNGVLVRGEAGMPVGIEGKKDQTELVAVKTIVDRAFEAGLITAGINWPCTRNSPSLTDNFPDVPEMVKHMTPKLREELVATGVLEKGTDAWFGPLSASLRDQIWTDVAVHVIRNRRPNLMVFHMLICDTMHHKYGAQSVAGYAAVAQADRQVKDVMSALSEAGILEKTTIFIVSDHGFVTINKLVQPNIVFRKNGLLTAQGLRIAKAKAQIISEGGIAMVYLTDPATAKEDAVKVKELMAGLEGVERILEPKDYPALGLPDPARHRGMGDLVLVAKDGYGYTNTAIGEEAVINTVMGVHNVGIHGVVATNPKMNAAFIAWGKGIEKGGRIGVIENVDIAPTVGKILGIDLGAVDGKVLEAIFER